MQQTLCLIFSFIWALIHQYVPNYTANVFLDVLLCLQYFQMTVRGEIKGSILICAPLTGFPITPHTAPYCCTSNSNQVSICLEFTKQPFIFTPGKKIKAF